MVLNQKPIEHEFELKVKGKKRPVSWLGTDGVNAAQRYADAHPGQTVLAWRWPRAVVRVGHPNQIEG